MQADILIGSDQIIERLGIYRRMAARKDEVETVEVPVPQ